MSRYLLLLSIVVLTACNGRVTIGPIVIPAPKPSSTVTPIPTPTPTASPTTPVTDLYDGPVEVAKYVQSFIDDAKREGVDALPNMKNPKLKIQFGSLTQYGPNVIGLCSLGSGLRTVTFSPTYWNNATDQQKMLISHHELGHCVMLRNHRTDLLSNGKYASIMYPIILDTNTFMNNESYYLDELFNWQAAEDSFPNEIWCFDQVN